MIHNRGGDEQPARTQVDARRIADTMEGDDQRAPLLGSGAGAAGRPPSLRRRDSARSLRSSFLSRLPDKVRAGLDPERLNDLDLARAKGLSKGNLVGATTSCEL